MTSCRPRGEICCVRCTSVNVPRSLKVYAWGHFVSLEETEKENKMAQQTQVNSLIFLRKKKKSVLPAVFLGKNVSISTVLQYSCRSLLLKSIDRSLLSFYSLSCRFITSYRRVSWSLNVWQSHKIRETYVSPLSHSCVCVRMYVRT